MNELTDLLQQRIEQLEAGQPLELCLAGLPPQEADALQLVAALQKLSPEEVEETSIAAQRAGVLASAKQHLRPSTTPPPAIPFSTQWRQWVDWLLMRRELVGGLAAILLILIVGMATITLWRNRGAGEESIALVPTSQPDSETVAATPTPMPSTTAVANTNPPTETRVPADAGQLQASNIITTFLPILTVHVDNPAQTAILSAITGLVEVQQADGSWTAVGQNSALTAGQQIRTGRLSQATLTFHDGSKTQLQASSHLSIEELNAQRSDTGLRTIILRQHAGSSSHWVDFRNDGGSVYRVHTPSGEGIARGTQFTVSVTPSLFSQFSVSEGQVDVTGLNQTVAVVAGQSTAVLAGSPPEQPAFYITGEGEVSQIGPVWTVGGQSFQTHSQTTFEGNPQVGDLVFVAGRLLADGSRLADHITLLTPPLGNRFNLTGQVTSIDANSWLVSGQTILVDDETDIDDDIELGDTVQVNGRVLAGGALLARDIDDTDDTDGLPFRFTGVVQQINPADQWYISGKQISTNGNTVIADDLTVGSIVDVSGWIMPDGRWLARRILPGQEQSATFSIAGRIQSIDPWIVAHIPFETRPWTAIDDDIDDDDIVRVHGIILADGRWVAHSIDEIDDDDDDNDTIVLMGVLSSIDPWIVNGLQLVVGSETVIVGNPVVGMQVMVRIRLIGDGEWQLLSIRPLIPNFGIGCFVVNTAVVGLQGNQLNLQNWPALTLNDDLQIEGVLEPNSIVNLPICFGIDGTVIIIGPIIIIHQPIIIIVPPQPPSWGGNFNDNDNDNDNHNDND